VRTAVLQVHLVTKGWGVDYIETTRSCFVANKRRDTVGAENHSSARGYFGQLVDENGTHRPQLFDHVPVMNDFLADVDGWRVEL
jgi:hypothetical protein